MYETHPSANQDTKVERARRGGGGVEVGVFLSVSDLKTTVRKCFQGPLEDGHTFLSVHIQRKLILTPSRHIESSVRR